ncbi:hypothetical protein, partial [Rhizobium leguminosarum]|uniref:hypothetical protein n=1 Tax=Rhizobium leguminosarum TaxID=384 RepID=UPI003F99537C
MSKQLRDKNVVPGEGVGKVDFQGPEVTDVCFEPAAKQTFSDSIGSIRICIFAHRAEDSAFCAVN